jgi:hypothetical protein
MSSFTEASMTECSLGELAVAALSDFARAANTNGAEIDANKIRIEIVPKPHKPSGLPIGKMAVYCFLLNNQALKIGIAGPKSGARYRSQHYNPNSAQSTLAGSILKHPTKLGIVAVTAISVGDWIKAHTDRINFLLPASYGKSVLSQLESFLHGRWKPTFEGVVSSDHASRYP